MKVAYLVGSLRIGGIERFVSETVIRGSRSKTISPTVICLDHRDGPLLERVLKAGILVVGPFTGWERNPKELIRLSRQIARLKPDILHSQINSSFMQQIIAAKFSGVHALLITEHNMRHVNGIAWLRKLIQLRLLDKVGVWHSAVSHAIATNLSMRFGIARDRITILPHGVDSAEPDAEARQSWRKRLGWRNESFGVGCVARLDESKGQRDLILAIARLRGIGHDVRACLIGDGKDRKYLSELTKDLGLTEFVSMVGLLEDPSPALEAMDAFVLYSKTEGFGLALAEAMAHGLPCAASDIPSLREVLDDGNAGLLVPLGAPGALAEALHRLLTDGSLRRSLSSAARSRAERVYASHQAYGRLLHHYQDMISRSQTSLRER